MGSKIKILIAEDEAVSALSMQMALSKAGYNVCGVVSTGEEAIELARQETPDLIVMDVILNGDVNGIDATEQIRSGSNVPVIFITGFNDEEIFDRIRSFKSTAFLIKPFTPDALESAIAKALL